MGIRLPSIQKKIVDPMADAGRRARHETSFETRTGRLVKSAEDSRSKDMKKGNSIYEKYSNTPDFDRVLEGRRAFANGLSDSEFDVLRNRGASEINTGLQTGLRQLRGIQATSGVRGGAAGAQALNLLADANKRHQGLASDLAAQDIAVRRQGLNDLEGTITGERGARMGSMFGMAGLGSTDRANAAQNILSQDFISAQGRNLANAQNMQVPGAFDKWTGMFGGWGRPGVEDLLAPTVTLPMKGANYVTGGGGDKPFYERW